MSWRFRVQALKHLTHLSPARIKPVPSRRHFCTADKKNSDKASEYEASLAHYHESYRQLDNLDFATSAKIVFDEPPGRKNKFGFDFHVVQFFIALMPSLAVYLVALYARREMRIMQAELDVKKKIEDEEKLIQLAIEEEAVREKARNSPDFLEVKTRLDRLEEALTEITVASKMKQQQEEDGHDSEKKHQTVEKEESKALISKLDEKKG